MKSVCVLVAMATACTAFAETHIGFEAEVDTKWNVIRITDFYATGRARGSGLGTGDVLVAVDRVQIKHPKTINRYVKRKKPGDVVIVTVRRNNDAVEKKVVLVDSEELRKNDFLGYVGGR